jgi:hypothetical protein
MQQQELNKVHNQKDMTCYKTMTILDYSILTMQFCFDSIFFKWPFHMAPLLFNFNLSNKKLFSRSNVIPT